MRLLRLDVENYGIFGGQTFEFEPHFTLVFGPNEAGKSTLLQLIREQLFGFKHQNPYSFANHTGKMAAEAELELADGQRLRYRRQKGRPDGVHGELPLSGQKVDATTLTSLLGGLTRERYELLFGFSLQELAAGQESLNKANIGEALYGGALGSLTGFQQVRAELQAEADSLLTGRGKKKVIDLLLGKIKDQAKEQRDAAVKPSAYKELAKDCEAAAAEVARTRQRVDELRREAAQLDRVARALEPWARYQHAANCLSNLQVPANLPPDAAEQLQLLKKRRTELAETLQEVESDLQSDSDELANLKLAPELVTREAEIRQLQQRITQTESCRADSAVKSQEAATIKAGVAAQLCKLHPKWDESHLQQFESTLVQRETIQRLQGERQRLDSLRSEVSGKRSEIEAGIASLQRQLEELGTIGSWEHLEALLDESSAYSRDRDRLCELGEAAAEQDEQIAISEARLRAAVGLSSGEHACLPLTRLSVPLEATVIELRDRWKQLDGDQREAQRQLDRTKQELADKQAELEQQETDSTVPDREQLLARRRHRDTGWQLIRQGFIEGEDLDERALRSWLQDPQGNASTDLQSVVADAYEQALAAADDVADERQQKHQLVAKCDQLKAEIRRIARRVESESRTAARLTQQHAADQTAWQAAWAACPFEPHSPEAMLSWLNDYNQLSEQHAQRHILQRKIEDLRSRLDGFETRLAESFSGEPADATILLAKAKQLIKAGNEASAKRQLVEKQLPERQQALQVVDQDWAELDARDTAWQASWQKLLDEFSFPHDWDIHVAAKMLAGLAEARSAAFEAKSLEQRVADMQQEISSFEAHVGALCEQIAPDLMENAAEHATSDLSDRLQAAKQAQRDDERLRQNTSKLSKRLCDVRVKLNRTESEIAELFKLAEAETERDFEQTASDARLFTQLCRDREEAEREIGLIRGNEDGACFAEQLKAANPDAVGVEQKRLQDDLQRATEEADEAFTAHTLKDRERAEMKGGSRAAELAQDVESTRGQLSSVIDRWAPLILAQAIMKRAIDKFEREHQPAVMADVGRLLQQMTLGRYVAIERKLDEQGTLLVVDESGDRKTPSQLSTGTREQLYLAIRLAYIQHYCHDAEPLPIVMDDVLVNFDAERARQTLTVVAETASNIQTIFLTCHEHMVRLAQEVLPSSTPVILPGGELPSDVVTAARVVQQGVTK